MERNKLNQKMEKYNLDTVCTGNHKADHINSRIMELADDIATELALKDWGETRANFYVEASDGSGEMMCEEAHGIWEVYYDQYVDILYKFTNTVIELDAPTDEEKAIANLSHYVSEDDVATAYKVLLDASEEFGDNPADDYVLMWEPMSDRYTVNELLDQL